MAIVLFFPIFERLFPGAPQVTFVPGILSTHGFWFVWIWLMERVFNAFVERGVFDPAGARWLKWLGGLFVGAGILHLAGGAHAVATNEIHGLLLMNVIGCFDSIVIGAFILTLGWVLEEACELREQQEFTI